MAINGEAPHHGGGSPRVTGRSWSLFDRLRFFDGSKTTPYLPRTTCRIRSGAYGRTKLAGDRAIQQVDCDHLIFRLCWVYGARGANFMLTMMRLARERERLPRRA